MRLTMNLTSQDEVLIEGEWMILTFMSDVTAALWRQLKAKANI